MKRNCLALQLLFSFCVFVSAAFAAWNADPTRNTYVAAGPGFQGSPEIVSDGTGGAFIAWRAEATSANIFVRRVLADGDFPWLAVDLGSAAMHQPFRIATDAAGGVIVAWRSSATDVRAQRVGPDGAKLWGVAGVQLASTAREPPAIVDDGFQGAVIAWSDSRGGVYAQRLDPTGLALWSSGGNSFGGVPVCTASGVESEVAAAADGAGGAIVAWTDTRNGNEDIYAQRVGGMGEAMWSMDGVAVHAGLWSKSLPLLLADGAGGAYVGYSYLDSGEPDTRIQRLDAGGASLWTAGGVSPSPGRSFEGNLALAHDGLGNIIAKWENSSQLSWFVGSNIYAQKLDAGGARLWGLNGITVCGFSGAQRLGALLAAGGGAYFVWSDDRSSGETTYADLYAQRVDAFGNLRFDVAGVPVCTAPRDQREVQLVLSGADAICVWEDDRGQAPSDVYVQNLHADGSLGPEVPVGVMPPGARRLSVAVQNPARRTASLWYILPHASLVRLRVYDVLGRTRIDLDVGFRPEGEHHEELGVLGLPNGTYWLSLQASGKTTTRQISVLR